MKTSIVSTTDLFGISPESARHTAKPAAAVRGEPVVSHAAKEAFLLLLLADSRVPRTAKVAATVLLLKFLNAETGECSPSGVELSRATSFTTKTVYVALEDLRGTGWIIIERGKGGSPRHTHNYVFDLERVKSTSPLARVPA